MKEIIYFLPDVDAGVTSIVRNLLRFRPQSDIKYKVVFTRQVEREAVFIKDQFNVDEQIVFTYSKYENLYSVVNRLKKVVSSPESILVANDGIEIRMVELLKLPNPLVYIIHGDFNYYYVLINQHQGVMDGVISYSLFTQKKLKEKIPEKDHSKISLHYYPVPEQQLADRMDKSVDLLFVGSFNERKGVQYLHEIYKRVTDKLPNTTFNIVGSGELESQLKSDFQEEADVAFLGQLPNDDVFQEMQKAKVLLFPSLSEGLPNVVVEAMKSKCVPVCHNIDSGIPDLIDHNETGMRVEIGNVEVFSDVVVKLLENTEKREAIAMQAQNKAFKMFNPEQNAKAYEEQLLNTKAVNKLYTTKKMGGILNQTYLPNAFVKFIRKFELSKKL
ncbi:glycosyltransferase family 4 protein [Mangrovimonas sp. TPBH4]|uniref:glycosyltransferase family 4 protein n=1 Tax=Mangrovimonas sp. TPBH4 TaxID=1645914 RepID=UPI0006B55275|nr:glycosyltransferase family 4 protein [Mangrovimonas sp. TPBH4]